MNVRRPPKVFIVVLNWNGAEDTVKCIESFIHLQYPDYELVIVDNGSTDDSVKLIKGRFSDITLIETGKNLGYAGGNNVGIRYALDNKAEYVLIVNNDTELVNPHFLHEMVDKMIGDASIGIIGPKILNPGNKAQNTILFTPILFNCIKKSFSFRVGTKISKDYNISQQVEVVSGVCWLVRLGVIEDVGLLDEDYFMYGEEHDYCYRARTSGWKIMYYPVESILHYKESTDKNEERTHRQYIYARRNLVLFLLKHFGFLKALLLASMFLASNILKVTFGRLIMRRTDFYNILLLVTLFYEFKDALNGKRK